MHHIRGMFLATTRVLSCLVLALTTRRLWMSAVENNLLSTHYGYCFRRSEATFLEKNFGFHRMAHRLCTSCGMYSTPYPQVLRTVGFAARRTGATVAENQFPARVRHLFQDYSNAHHGPCREACG